MFYLPQNRSWHLVPALVLVPTDPGLTGEKGLEGSKCQGMFREKDAANLAEHQQLGRVKTLLVGFAAWEDCGVGVEDAQHHILSKLEERVVHQGVKISTSKVGVEGVKEDDVHVADHEGRLDGDGGDEVDGGLVEEEVVGDAWHQGDVAAAKVVELLKSYVTYLVQNVFRKTAETVVKSREEWGNTKLVLPFKREDAC